MKTLTKAQAEAIVGEVQDRLRELENPEILPKRAEESWKKLKERITSFLEMERREEELREQLEELEEQNRDAKKQLEKFVSEFEDKQSLEVSWQYLDEGEEPTVRFPARDYRDKISRQIQILSIDKNGPLTADDLIETIINKMTKTSSNKMETI